MTTSVEFVAPDGQETSESNAERVAQMIRCAGDSYWASGSGDAALRFVEDGKVQAEMIMMVREAYGVFLQHLYNTDGVEYVLSLPGTPQEEVTIRHSGSPWTLPRSFFVDKETAIKALERFVRDGRRIEDGNWVQF
jgi:hypothetical protein